MNDTKQSACLNGNDLDHQARTLNYKPTRTTKYISLLNETKQLLLGWHSCNPLFYCWAIIMGEIAC